MRSTVRFVCTILAVLFLVSCTAHYSATETRQDSPYEDAGSLQDVPEEKTDASERELIRIGALSGIHDRLSLWSFISYFNRVQNTYRAEAVYYSDLTTLALALYTGDAPDVIEIHEINYSLNSTHYIDLLPLIKADDNIPDQFFWGQLPDIMTGQDLGLYALPDALFLNTLVGRSGNVGDLPGWTMGDLYDVLQQNKELTMILPPWQVAENILYWACRGRMGQFIDQETATCDFTGKAFIELLNLCAQQPRIMRLEGYTSDYTADILLTREEVQSIDRIAAIDTNYGLESYTYIGYPNDEKTNGSILSPSRFDLQFAIPVSAQNPVKSWQFVRHLLDEEWQQRVSGIPLSALQLRESGQKLIADAELSFTADDWDNVMQVLECTEWFSWPDEEILQIILEEADALIAGQKTAEEVASIIQNRVSILLAERN